jgi:hypothetical protein
VVKRAYVELRERVSYLKRLAFYTITEEEAAGFDWVHLTGSNPEEIDVVMPLDEVDLEAMRRALDCYVTYAATIPDPQERVRSPSRWDRGSSAISRGRRCLSSIRKRTIRRWEVYLRG